jgi:hypothetical protein
MKGASTFPSDNLRNLHKQQQQQQQQVAPASGQMTPAPDAMLHSSHADDDSWDPSLIL